MFGGDLLGILTDQDNQGPSHLEGSFPMLGIKGKKI